MFYKIFHNADHPVSQNYPPLLVPSRMTRCTAAMHDYVLLAPRCRTLQYSRSFVPASVTLWNSLPSNVFDGVELCDFKVLVNRSLLD